MYLKKTKTVKGRIFLQIVNGYRDSDGKSKQEVIEKIGYVDELIDKYDDPIAHFTKVAEKMTKDDLDDRTLVFDSYKELDENTNHLRNVGYLALKPILENLKLTPIFNALETKYQTTTSLESIFNFLIYSQIITPSSKRSSYLKKHLYFENFDFSEDQLYRSLSVFGNSYEAIKDKLFKLTNDVYPLDTSTTFYDGTNFYFEIDKEDDFRKKGPSKENQPNPLVSIGLLLDNNGIPIDINIYPGNESEKDHFTKTISEMKIKNKIKGKTIYVADKGLNTQENVYRALINGDGYIYSQTVKGAKEELKGLIESDLGFESVYDKYGNEEFRIKDYIDEVVITDKDGKKHKIRQKYVITWSKKYAEKTLYERNKLIKKAKGFINNPAKYKKDQLGASAKYLSRVTFDNKGNLVKDKSSLVLNNESIKKESRMDGFYLIVTSETNMEAMDIFKKYHSLNDIEETFKVTKSFLKVRPVYLQREERIKAHVLVAYTSLIILRILEKNILKSEYSYSEIINSLREYECTQIKPNRYFFFSYNKVIEKLGLISKSNVKLETKNISEIRNLFKY